MDWILNVIGDGFGSFPTWFLGNTENKNFRKMFWHLRLHRFRWQVDVGDFMLVTIFGLVPDAYA